MEPTTSCRPGQVMRSIGTGAAICVCLTAATALAIIGAATLLKQRWAMNILASYSIKPMPASMEAVGALVFGVFIGVISRKCDRHQSIFNKHEKRSPLPEGISPAPSAPPAEENELADGAITGNSQTRSNPPRESSDGEQAFDVVRAQKKPTGSPYKGKMYVNVDSYATNRDGLIILDKGLWGFYNSIEHASGKFLLIIDCIDARAWCRTDDDTSPNVRLPKNARLKITETYENVVHAIQLT